MMDGLLSAPSIAQRNSDGSEIRQATSLLTSQGPVRLIASTHVANGLPPELLLFELTIDSIDPQEDIVELVREVAGWHRELPNPDQAPATLAEPWALIGDPLRRGIPGAPQDWRAQMSAVASTLGTHARFAETSATARALNVMDLENKYALPGACTIDDVRDHAPLVVLGDYGSSYESIEQQLIECLVDVIRIDPRATRKTIAAGSTIYHRKINSGGGRDYFGNPLAGPCKHGSASYVRFHSAPQATKGMLALYDNFDESMLYHCKHYPKCNVYAVIRPPEKEES